MMKIKPVALAIMITISANVNAGGVPVVDAIRNAIAGLELSEALIHTGHMVKDAANQATQIANQSRQIIELVNQLRALTESGGFGDLLEGMAMDEFRYYAPELATVVDIFSGDHGGVGDYAGMLQDIAGIVSGDEIFGEIAGLSEAAAAIHGAYNAARQRVGYRYGVATATAHHTKRRIDNAVELIRNIERTSSVKTSQDLGNRIAGEQNVLTAELIRLQALQLQQQSEREAVELAALANYRAKTLAVINFE